MLSVKQSRT